MFRAELALLAVCLVRSELDLQRLIEPREPFVCEDFKRPDCLSWRNREARHKGNWLNVPMAKHIGVNCHHSYSDKHRDAALHSIGIETESGTKSFNVLAAGPKRTNDQQIPIGDIVDAGWLPPTRPNFDREFDVIGRRIPTVVCGKLHVEPIIGEFPDDLGYRKVGPHLGLANFSLTFVRSVSSRDSSSVRVESLFNQDYADDRDEETYAGNDRREPGPPSHVPLGIKIAFLTPLIPFGFWISLRGVNAVDWRDTSLRHVLECASLILVGAAASTLSLIMLLS